MSLSSEIGDSGSQAPLLAETDAYPDNDPEAAPSDDGQSMSDSQYSGGWFIWSLTFSAGLSGLLFGYEWVDDVLLLRYRSGKTYSFCTCAVPVSSRLRL